MIAIQTVSNNVSLPFDYSPMGRAKRFSLKFILYKTNEWGGGKRKGIQGKGTLVEFQCYLCTCNALLRQMTPVETQCMRPGFQQSIRFETIASQIPPMIHCTAKNWPHKLNATTSVDKVMCVVGRAISECDLTSSCCTSNIMRSSKEVIGGPPRDHGLTRSWARIKLKESVFEMLVNLHDCGLITTSVTVVWC